MFSSCFIRSSPISIKYHKCEGSWFTASWAVEIFGAIATCFAYFAHRISSV